MSQKKESKVETAKRGSHYLRGGIARTLESGASHFEDGDVQILKFHGAYQQDDRDRRRELQSQGKEKAYQLMVRMAIPGGRLSAGQYLAVDPLADTCAKGSMRITTRQGLQLHGVAARDLRRTIARINDTLLTTLSACGDVPRNVMACPAPLDDEPHRLTRELAAKLARELRPSTRAYHEIWLDGEKIAGPPARQSKEGDEEPFFGPQYLPRKFKTAIAPQGDNCVDVYSQDCGLLLVAERSSVRGINLLVGGGMGMTHRKADTFARLGEPLAFIETGHAIEAVRVLAAIFRDHGNRGDRRHARLKYLLASWGMDRLREEFRRRVSFEPSPPLRLPPPQPRDLAAQDHLGIHRQRDGKWFVGVFVENGRIADRPGRSTRTALREVIARHEPHVVLTPHQNILLADLPDAQTADAIEAALREHGLRSASELSSARRNSMACPALPTCGLALAESERVMPQVLEALEGELEALGLLGVPLTIRMTGCPNGCARTYLADLALVGRGPGVYQVYVGGSLAGDRVADLYAADVAVERILDLLRPLLKSWAAHRRPDEGLGDFYQRILGRKAPRKSVTGLESPTSADIKLP